MDALFQDTASSMLWACCSACRISSCRVCWSTGAWAVELEGAWEEAAGAWELAAGAFWVVWEDALEEEEAGLEEALEELPDPEEAALDAAELLPAAASAGCAPSRSV